MLHKFKVNSCTLAICTKVKIIKLLKKDISFFESLLEENILLLSEQLYDENKIRLTSSENSIFHLECDDMTKSYSQRIILRKNKLSEYSCSCNSQKFCEHLGAALFFIRNSAKLLKKTKTPTRKKPRKNSNEEFINKIDKGELQNFLLSRMRADKDFRTLLYSRFLVEIEGVQDFENFLDKAFPPSKTTKITPAQKEVRLFSNVIDEMNDQIKDLIGRDNYIDASFILIPLIKKSFYFKNRFSDIPDSFKKTHIKLIEILKTILEIIEAPALKTQITDKIIGLMGYSYVELIEIKEKELIISLLESGINKTKTLKILGDTHRATTDNSYANFLVALDFVCSGISAKTLTSSQAGIVFVEIFTWLKVNPEYLDLLIEIVKNTDLPLRFKERLLALSTKNEKQKKEQSLIAVDSLKKSSSFSFFKWLYDHDTKTWLSKRGEIIDEIKQNDRHHLLIMILIEEKNEDELFAFLEEHNTIETYNQHLYQLLKISDEKTHKLYTNWLHRYLMIHFGEASKDYLAKNLNQIGTINYKLRKVLEQNIRKNFAKRPSLKS